MICSFTQTFGHPFYYEGKRDIIYTFKQFDKMDNYFRNKLDGNIYSFHNVPENTISDRLNNPFLKNTIFKIFRYNNVTYTESFRQSLLNIQELGFRYFVFLQDDVFTLKDISEKIIDDFIHIIRNNDFNIINLEQCLPFNELSNDNMICSYGDLKVYKTSMLWVIFHVI